MWINKDYGIETAHAESAPEFISLLRRSHPCWWEGTSMPWAFRGHSDESWHLLPTAWRAGDPVIEAGRREAARRLSRSAKIPRLIWIYQPANLLTGEFEFGPNDEVLARQLVIDANAELLPLFDFARYCNDYGLNTPMPNIVELDVQSGWLHNPEMPLIADEIFWYNDLPRGLALAQHHGLPTRLLDWTLDPIAAAFFSVENITTPAPGKNIAVWAIHRNNAEACKSADVQVPKGPHDAKLASSLTIFRPSVRDNHYLAAQSGLFTCIRHSGIHYMQNDGVRPALEDFVCRHHRGTTVLRKVTLSHEHIPELVHILQCERISRAAFMPTLDNVATDIRRSWLQKI